MSRVEAIPIERGLLLLDRIMNAQMKVRERLLRVTSILERNHVPYAVMGGNAVAFWVATIDESLVRNTRDIDILTNKEDLPKLRAALEPEGFIYRHVAGMDVFLDGPDTKIGDGVHLLFGGQKVMPEDPVTLPSLAETEPGNDFRVLDLVALVRTKLVAHRLKDRVHLLDMIGADLIDPSWVSRYPSPLAERLQALFDNPNG